ncbi:MAG TPA: family 2A encapsulin nanocompartment cargo protein cysteine desulfurase [Puia sp.]|nr:family 2A encapsulin nanocompartment cargo protein cysteine desulfurase [Puia sp.]
MSTNIDSGLPDTDALAQLANELFKASPGGNPQDAASDHLFRPGGTAAEPAGATPAAVTPAAVATKIPVSLAGSGRSPSALGSNNAFDVKDPQTSLPDPHFSDGRVPPSVAGSGRSPSTQTSSQPLPHSSSQPLPYAQGNSSDNGLKEILTAITSFTHLPQLPFPAANEGSFYFLKEANPLHLPVNFPSAGNVVNINGHSGLSQPPFDVELIKKDFPILKEYVNGRRLIWLDNAATTQKPQQVIDRLSYFYQHENSNIHRAAHELAARATDAYEEARSKVQRFINAGSPKEIVFVRGATEAINLVAKSWGEQHIGPGDEVIISHLEHHANIVPWQQLALKKGFKIKVIPVDDRGDLLLEEYAKLLNPKTKLVAFTQVSNALGTITPAKQIVAMAHHAGARVLVDGAQSVSHMRVDVQDLDADWFVFSGHKVFAPTGIGVLYGKEALLNETQPWQGGGNMIRDVTFEHTEYQDAPGRFEAGTGNIADAVGLGAAIDYVTRIGMDLIGQYEHYLLLYATKLLKEVPGLRLIGTAPHKASVLSFVLDGFTNDQVGQALNKEGIAVRTGHHCAQPILRRFGLESTVRPSLAFYNTCSDVLALVNVLHRLRSGY